MALETEKLQRLLQDILAAHPAVKLGILFGSCARGDQRRDSDLDLAVAGEKALELEQRIRVLEDLAMATARPIDLVDLQAAGIPILRQALTTGKLVYCKDRRLYAEIIKRMLFEEADFMPYRRRILQERRRAWINS
ncbi:MAG: type VII toxin-antitoxin system MntA family adenylyltransferase antitoxin [Gammaproteobacteria bacterium]